MAHASIRITLEVFDQPRGELGLRVHVDDAPLFTGPATAEGRKLALDALRRQAELEIDRLAGRCSG